MVPLGHHLDYTLSDYLALVTEMRDGQTVRVAAVQAAFAVSDLYDAAGLEGHPAPPVLVFPA